MPPPTPATDEAGRLDPARAASGAAGGAVPVGPGPGPGGRWSTPAVLGAVLALPCGPAGIMLSALGLRESRQGQRRGHRLAVLGLIVSLATTLLGSALGVHLLVRTASHPRAVAGAAPLAPTAGAPAHDPPAVGSGAAAPDPSPSRPAFDTVNGDVSVLDCQQDPITGAEVVTLSAMNRGADTKTYDIGLELRDASAATVGAGRVRISDVQAGQEVTGTTTVQPQGTAAVSACGIGVVAETTSYPYPAG